LLGIIVGLFTVWLAGDFVVRYAVQLAALLRISRFLVGFIVLAIAAALPELAVAVAAAFEGASEVSAGDIIGANFSDVAFVAGLVLFLAGPITLKKVDRYRLLSMFAIATPVLLSAWVLDAITIYHGFGILFLYAGALYFIWKMNKKHVLLHDELALATHNVSCIKKCDNILLSITTGKLVISLLFLLGSSWLTVHCAIGLARMCGVSLSLIGSTIFALGTSLPELTMSLSALRRKEYDLALAPTLGSILEHSLLVLGVLSVCSQSPINFLHLHIPMLFMFLAFAIICFGLLCRKHLERWLGILLLSLFVSYFVYQILRTRLFFM
jgi:cation:H+ antiporter